MCNLIYHNGHDSILLYSNLKLTDYNLQFLAFSGQHVHGTLMEEYNMNIICICKFTKDKDVRHP